MNVAEKKKFEKRWMEFCHVVSKFIEIQIVLAIDCVGVWFFGWCLCVGIVYVHVPT